MKITNICSQQNIYMHCNQAWTSMRWTSACTTGNSSPIRASNLNFSVPAPVWQAFFTNWFRWFGRKDNRIVKILLWRPLKKLNLVVKEMNMAWSEDVRTWQIFKAHNGTGHPDPRRQPDLYQSRWTAVVVYSSHFHVAPTSRGMWLAYSTQSPKHK